MEHKKLLITGFDPFGGETINPSWEAVRRLPDTIGNYTLTKMQIPTVFREAAKLVLAEAEKLHPGKAENIKKLLDEITRAEKANPENIDLISGLFGKVMADIVAMKSDSWEPLLKKLGFYLGKFIYIMDAYDDVEKDIESGSYNPFKNRFGKDGFEEEAERVLNMMMAECASSFELLPIVDNIEVLRNIIYAGVWTKFEMVRAGRKDKDGSL